MTFSELRNLRLFQTRSIATASKDSKVTHAYLMECLSRFFSGDYGEICQEDTDANNADLAAGEGHVLARYKAKHNLESDIYIESHFSKSVPGIDANNTMIMYCGER